MEFGTIENTSDKGCIYYFCVDTDSPSHPSQKNAHTYYVVTRVRSSERAFCFLCSQFCDLSDKQRMQQWYKLYQSSLEKVPFNVFFELVRTYVQCPPPAMGMPGHDHRQLVVPALFTDETSARQALRKLPSNPTLSPSSYKRPGTQQSSATPEKTAVMHTADRAAYHPHTSPQSSSPTPSLQSGDVAMSSIVGTSQPYAVFSLEAAGLRDLWERINVNSEKKGKVSKDDAERNQHPQQKQHEHQQHYYREAGQGRAPVNNDSGAEGVNVEVASDTCTDEEEQAIASDAHLGRGKRQQRGKKAHAHDASAKSSDRELVNVLKSQLLAKELELESERRSRQEERLKFQTEITSFEAQLQEMSSAHGKVLYKLVRENKETVNQLEADMAKKEEELHRIYDVRVQDRDVRIVQLTESVRTLEKRTQELEHQAGDFAELQGYIKEWESCYATARSEYAKVLEQNEKLRGDLARAQLLVEQQQKQVAAAGHSMQKMQNGLAMVRDELPHLLKSVLFPTGTGINAVASQSY